MSKFVVRFSNPCFFNNRSRVRPILKMKTISWINDIERFNGGEKKGDEVHIEDS